MEKKITTLGELNIGDRFTHLNDRKDRFEVVGKKEYNPRHGSPTRMCHNLTKKQLISKSCRLRVIAFLQAQLNEV